MDKSVTTFNSESEKYFSGRPRYPRKLYEYISGLCTNHDAAWDCGCGNGQVSIDLVPFSNRVEASDIHERQILNAYSHPKIRYSVQNSEKPSYPDSSFDLVVAAQCIHWFNLDDFFPEARRVLKPDGIFACRGYGCYAGRRTSGRNRTTEISVE